MKRYNDGANTLGIFYAFILGLAVAFGLALWAATPAKGADAMPPAKPEIRLPVKADPPTPMPGPDVPAKLDPSTWYVVDSDDAGALVLASPAGLVTVTKETGPVKVRGKFADGSGATETRTYKGKVVYFIEATHTGRVELLIIPSGVTDPIGVLRRLLDVNDGTKPQPPPIPVPPAPEPTPPGPTPVTAKKLYLAVVKNPRDVTPAQAQLLGDTPFWDSLKAAGHEWDTWASDSPRAKDLGYLDAVAAAGVTLPALVVLNKETGGRPLAVVPLPADKAGVSAVVKQLTGGK